MGHLPWACEEVRVEAKHTDLLFGRPRNCIYKSLLALLGEFWLGPFLLLNHGVWLDSFNALAFEVERVLNKALNEHLAFTLVLCLAVHHIQENLVPMLKVKGSSRLLSMTLEGRSVEAFGVVWHEGESS